MLSSHIHDLMQQGYRSAATRFRQLIRAFSSQELREALNQVLISQREMAGFVLTPLACEAAGGDPKITLMFTDAMFQLARGLDMIDDVIDESFEKHGKKTLLGTFGAETTLILAAGLLFNGGQLFTEIAANTSFETSSAVTKVFVGCFLELGEAIVKELGFRQRLDVQPVEYVNMLRQRASLSEACTHVGALLGGGDQEQVALLAQYGRKVGTLKGLTNDMQDVLGDQRELTHRLHKESAPLPVLYGLEDSIVVHLVSKAIKRELSEAEQDALIVRLEETGALAKTVKRIEITVEQALDLLTNAPGAYRLKNTPALKAVVEDFLPKRNST